MSAQARRDDAYLAALVRAHLLAPDAAESDGTEEDCLAQALEEACDRLGLDLGDVQERESARLHAEGLL